MVDPIVYYIPTFAPAGISFYSGDRYPGWKNTSLFVGAGCGTFTGSGGCAIVRRTSPIPALGRDRLE
jgi:hypothetical protein